MSHIQPCSQCVCYIPQLSSSSCLSQQGNQPSLSQQMNLEKHIQTVIHTYSIEYLYTHSVIVQTIYLLQYRILLVDIINSLLSNLIATGTPIACLKTADIFGFSRGPRMTPL